jgi:hypothetical protein
MLEAVTSATNGCTAEAVGSILGRLSLVAGAGLGACLEVMSYLLFSDLTFGLAYLVTM